MQGATQGPEHARLDAAPAGREGAEHAREAQLEALEITRTRDLSLSQGPEHAPDPDSGRDALDGGPSLAVPSEDLVGAVKQPVHGRRGTLQGPRGCWAVNGRGEPCAAPRVRSSDYCSAHNGLGISQDPAGYAKLGGQANRERSASRAAIRLAFGNNRTWSPRSALRAETALRASQIAGRAVDAVLDPKVKPEVAHRLALELIDAVDPLSVLTMEASLPDSPEGLSGLSLAQLMTMAESHGINENAAIQQDPDLKV